MSRLASRGLSAVVNSAGIGLDRPAVDTSVADFRRILDVNLIGSFVVAHMAARAWLDRGQPGAIVNISSVSGMTGNKGRSAYGASKGGVNVLTYDSWPAKLGPHGIRVNAVAPGPIDTPLARSVHTDDVRRQWMERVPQRRYGLPEEVAGRHRLLCCRRTPLMLNGQILAVDGGFLNAGLAVWNGACCHPSRPAAAERISAASCTAVPVEIRLKGRIERQRGGDGRTGRTGLLTPAM